MEFVKYPKDIAKAVFGEIKRRKTKFLSEDILVDLFEIMYFASIRTEEAEPKKKGSSLPLTHERQ